MGTLAIIGAMVGTLQGGLYRAIQAMFAASEKGVWYDPSDMQTLFQDSAGTTPVTAVTQPVGLMLDKSQGLVLGPELVVNTSGVVFRDNVNPTSSYDPAMSVVAGKSYRITYTISENTSTSSASWRNFGAGAVVPPTVLAGFNGTVSAVAHATLSSSINLSPDNTFVSFNITNISVRELPGYHATQPTSTARPVLGREPIGGRRNLLTYTEDFGNAAWVKTNLAVSGTVVSNTDTISNIKVICLLAPSGVTSGTITQYFDVMAGSVNFAQIRTYDGSLLVTSGFNIQTGAVDSTGAGHSCSVVDLGGGVFRCAVTYNYTGTTTRAYIGLYKTAGQAANAYAATSIGSDYIYVFRGQFELGSTPTAYQRVVSALDVTEAGVNDAYYVDTDGVDDAAIQAAGGGGSTGFFLCAAVHIDALGAAKTIWSDAGTNTGYILRINASNQLELAAGNSTAYTLAATTDTLAINTAYVVTAWDDGTNLNVQINSGTAGTAARPVVSAGTATATLGKDNGAATGFFNGAIFPLVYVRNGENVDAADRTAAKAYVASKAGITL